MGVDIHEKKRVEGATDRNPLAKIAPSSQTSADQFVRNWVAFGPQVWRSYKAKAKARKIRRMWYHA